MDTKHDFLPKGNSDPEFDKIIGKRTPQERSMLYVVCVLVRFTLYSLVYVFRDKYWMPGLVGSLSLFSVYQLTKPTKNTQWWSKKFQLIMALLVLLSAFAVQFMGADPKSMPALLFISLAGGILQRLNVTLY